MSGSRDNLTPKQHAAVQALLSSVTMTEAARKAKVSTSTLRRWLKEPAFRAAVSQERRHLLESAVNLLHQGAELAVGELLRGLKEPEPGDRRRSADLLLVHLARLRGELDVNDRIEELARMLEELRRERQTAR